MDLNLNEIRDKLGWAVCDLDTAVKGIRIKTPLYYPDGDVIEIFIVEDGNGFKVTDYGATIGWLRMRSPDGDLSEDQRRVLKSVCECFELELANGCITKHVTGEDIVRFVFRVAQAAYQAAAYFE